MTQLVILNEKANKIFRMEIDSTLAERIKKENVRTSI